MLMASNWSATALGCAGGELRAPDQNSSIAPPPNTGTAMQPHNKTPSTTKMGTSFLVSEEMGPEDSFGNCGGGGGGGIGADDMAQLLNQRPASRSNFRLARL